MIETHPNFKFAADQNTEKDREDFRTLKRTERSGQPAWPVTASVPGHGKGSRDRYQQNILCEGQLVLVALPVAKR